MPGDTVLFFASAAHPAMDLLFAHVRDRGHRRAVYVVQERFPRDLGLCLPLGVEGADGFLEVPGEEPVAFDALASVCLDGYYVDPDRFSDLDPADVEYAQTESWSALIALFGHLAGRCLVANHVTQRERVASRLAELSYLASVGFDTPRVLATSSPDDARAFIADLEGRAIYKPVSGHGPFRVWEDADLERLDAIRLAPVHFEEEPLGETRRCVVIGSRVFVLPARDAPPAEVLERCLEACRGLDLVMGEVVMRSTPGGWHAGALRCFPGADCFVDDEMRDAAARLLEEGRWEEGR